MFCRDHINQISYILPIKVHLKPQIYEESNDDVLRWIDNDHLCSVELNSLENTGLRPSLLSNFFLEVYIPLNTRDHCLPYTKNLP